MVFCNSFFINILKGLINLLSKKQGYDTKKSKDYYKNDKERLRKKARDKYKNLSEEEKNEQQKLKEYQKITVRLKSLNQ